VCLNYCLIGGNLGFPALGVRGAAIATVCGSIVACIISIIFASRKNGYLRFRISLPRFDKKTLSGLFKVGSSSIAETVFLRLGFLINSKLVAGIGTNAIATYQIIMQVTGLSFTLGDGIATAGTTLVGQALGAKRKDLAMANVMISRKLAIIVSIFLMVTIFLLRSWLPTMFTDDASIIAGSAAAFFVVVLGMIPQNGRVVYSGCLRGAGDVKFVAMISLVCVAVVRPALTWIMCYPMANVFPEFFVISATGPWISFVIESFLRQYLLYRRVKTGKWLLIKL